MSDAKLVIAGDSEKAQQAITNLEKRLDKLQNGLRQVSQRTKQTTSEGQTSWKQVAGGILTAEAATSLLNTTLNKTIDIYKHQLELAKQAAQQVKGAANPLGNLISMANTPEERDKLIAESKALFASGAVTSQGAAYDLTFAMTSAGLNAKDKETIATLARNQLLRDPASSVDNLSTLQTAMGAKETGSFKDLVSKAFAASQATKTNMGDILSASATSGTSAGALGMSDEEVLSATAVLSKATKSADIAATQLKALFTAMDKLGEFQGKGLDASIMDITGRGLSGEGLQNLLGSSEAINAYRLLAQNRELIQTVQRDVEKAQKIGLSDIKVKLAGSTPELAASMVQQMSANTLEVSRSPAGVNKLLADAIADDMQKQADRRGALTSYFMSTMNSIDRMTLGDEMWMDQRPAGFWSGIQPSAQVMQKTAEIQQQMLKQQQEMVTELKQINNKTEKPERVLRRNGDQ